MEGMFRQLGIYSTVGQLYRPQDADQLMWYREDKAGQILQEGITEAGAMCSWIAAATSYSTHGVQMLPFYIFYSMFGFQRIGDLRVGRRRHAHARLSARRHVRPHDAQRRRPAARGRPLAPVRGVDSELRAVRSDVCVRGRGDRAGRRAPHAARAGRRLLLHHADERELPASGDARRRRRRHLARHVPAARRRRREARPAARAADGQRRDPARGARGGRPAARRLRRGRRRVERDELHAAAPRRRVGGALEPAASGGDAASARTSPSSSTGTTAR